MNPRLFLWFALAALPLGATGCAKQSAEGTRAAPSAEAQADAFGKMTVDELDAKLADAKAGKLSLYIYDNNDKGRYDKGHIPTAKWVQHDAVKAGDLPSDKEATLVFYCANEH